MTGQEIGLPMKLVALPRRPVRYSGGASQTGGLGAMVGERFLKVRARNRRAWSDVYDGWWDVFNTLAVVVGISLFVVWVAYDISSDRSTIVRLLNVSPPIPKLEVIGLLFSVFVSGSVAAGLWIYQDCLNRWTMGQAMRAAATAILDTFMALDVFERLRQTLLDLDIRRSPPALGASYFAFYSENMDRAAFLAAGVRSHVAQLFQKIATQDVLSNHLRMVSGFSEGSAPVELRAYLRLTCGIFCHALLVVRKLNRRVVRKYDEQLEACLTLLSAVASDTERTEYLTALRPYYFMRST